MFQMVFFKVKIEQYQGVNKFFLSSKIRRLKPFYLYHKVSGFTGFARINKRSKKSLISS